ncbi:MAG: ABC transporter ATP-binding protein [Dehalococcoidia bacterium]
MSTTPSQAVIEVENLTKYYGDFPAIENVTFSVRKGEVLGFLGPNAAGKTTTMRILTGFMPPTSGAARVAGFDVVDQSLEARRRIGYLPESVPLYTDMTVTGYLEFMGTIRGMEPQHIRRRISEVIDICRLGDYRQSLIGKLSKGFRQRVGVAQAILHEPEVLILDEPTIGIDPIQVVETRQLIRDLGGDHTVILSTHILPEASIVCQRVVIIHEGQVVAEDQPANLAERIQGTQRVDLEVKGPIQEVTSALQAIAGVQQVTSFGTGETRRYSIHVKRGMELRDRIARVVVNNGWSLLRLEAVAMSLEEIFLKMTLKEEL